MMEEVANSEHTFEADLVLLALGFLGPEKAILKLLGVKEVPYFQKSFYLNLHPDTRVNSMMSTS